MASEDSKETTLPPIRAECFMLCDYAQAENGKLYILGGGWDQLAPSAIPSQQSASLAIKLVVPGKVALASVAIRIEILDDKGQPLGEPVVQGRIRGIPTGNLSSDSTGIFPDAAIFLAFAIGLDIQQAGRYEVRLMVDAKTIAETWFTVLAPAPEGIEADATQD
jgi:uncharacterized protein DUF6941